MTAVALIPVDLERSRLGLPSRAADRVLGQTVLAHTLRRVAAVPAVARIALVHPAGQDPAPLLAGVDLPKPLATFADPAGLHDRHTPRLRVARLWAPTAWRGGLGGATAFDELLPAAPLVAALDALGETSALLVGGDWCVVDPQLCQAVLAQHLAAPDGMKLTFSQAPPGLCGLATSAAVLRDLAEHAATFGHILGYNPRAPIGDPIGREANLPVTPDVRDTTLRFVFDTPRACATLRKAAAELGEDWLDAGAPRIAEACRRHADPFHQLPQQATLELTPRRSVRGPVTPQHYTRIDRPDLTPELAQRILPQLAAPGDTALLLGGLGDAMLHDAWHDIAAMARAAGVATLGVETDLLADQDQVQKLLDLPVDLVVVRLNADSADTYRRTMGRDWFATAIHNLEWLLNTRNRRAAAGHAPPGLPWVLPSMVKTRDTLPELEAFFDKWTVYAGHAVLAPACSGCGQMPELSPIPMAPPRRQPCRQLGRRLTLLSDGTLARCDQDWHGRGALGHARDERLDDLWRNADDLARQHAAGRFTELTLCGACHEWHRP